MFYFEQDRREIRGWLKTADDKVREELREEIRGWLKTADDKVREELREEIQTQIRKQHGNFITNQQLEQYDAKFKAFEAFIADDFDRLKNSADATAQEVKALKSAVNNVPAVDALTKKVADLSAENDELKDEIAALKAKVDVLQAAQIPTQPPVEVDALKKQLAQHDQNFAVVTKALKDIQKNFGVLLQQRDAQILSLKAEVDKFKDEIAALKAEVDKLKAENDALKKQLDQHDQNFAVVTKALKDEIAALKAEVDKLKAAIAPPDDDDKFFLLAQSDEYLPADRRQIPAKVKAALDMRELEQFLTEHPSTTSTQFQKILNNHAKEVKKFVDKLKLNAPDEELSETVTANYFKLFQRTIFDNLLIAIRRGFKASDKSANAFYSEFLALLNQYLMRCGIYSLNVTKGRKADSHDYENMTPQVIKTADETLAGMIDSIERLPYRINYRDEFGEQKFFQYAGIMNVYKAV